MTTKLDLTRRWALVAAPVLAALVTTFAAPSAQAQTQEAAPPAQQVLRLVTANMPRSLDPTNIDAQRLINNGFGEPLVHQSFDGTKLIAALAAEWSMVEPTRWRVKIQPNAKFWSGAPVTAEAVAASLRRHQTDNSRARTVLRDVKFLAAGPSTLEIVTPTANPAFLFSLVTLPIENVAAIATLGTAYATTGDMTGYFRPVQFIPGELIAGVPFEGHYGPRPKLERIEARFVVDPQTRYLALQSGQAEMDANVQFEQRRLYIRNRNITITERARSTWNVWMNYRHPLLGDPQMRQALNLGVNRDEIVSRVMAPFAAKPTAHFPAGLPYAIERTQPFDPAAAKAILDKMGWVPGPDSIRRKDGQTLEFRVLTYGWWQTIAVVLESQWRAIGVKVSLQVVEPAASNQIMLDGAFDIATYCSCPAPTGDLHGQLRQYYHSDSVQNWQRYSNPRVDTLLETLRTEADREKRYRLARDIQEILFDDTALLWVSNASVLSNAHGARVRGIDPERSSDITPGMFIAVQ